MDVPPAWQAALAAIQTVDPDAVIGGGCLRDLDNCREVKDIDIFVEGDKAAHLFELQKRLQDLAGVDYVGDIDDSTMYPIGDGNDVVGFFEIEFDAVDQPIQMIVVKWPTVKICDRFDFGICRIAFDGQKLTRTPEYEQDKRDQVFKLRRSRTDEEMVASVHRFARLTRKYDGWRFGLYDITPAHPVLPDFDLG